MKVASTIREKSRPEVSNNMLLRGKPVTRMPDLLLNSSKSCTDEDTISLDGESDAKYTR